MEIPTWWVEWAIGISLQVKLCHWNNTDLSLSAGVGSIRWPGLTSGHGSNINTTLLTLSLSICLLPVCVPATSSYPVLQSDGKHSRGFAGDAQSARGEQKCLCIVQWEQHSRAAAGPRPPHKPVLLSLHIWASDRCHYKRNKNWTQSFILFITLQVRESLLSVPQGPKRRLPRAMTAVHTFF